MGHVWILQPYNNLNTNLKNNTEMGHWAQNQASAWFFKKYRIKGGALIVAIMY